MQRKEKNLLNCSIDMNIKNLKHGDKVVATVNGVHKSDQYNAHIEDRMLNQWPDKRSALFVVIDSDFPHFPIRLDDFLSNYGSISISE